MVAILSVVNCNLCTNPSDVNQSREKFEELSVSNSHQDEKSNRWVNRLDELSLFSVKTTICGATQFPLPIKNELYRQIIILFKFSLRAFKMYCKYIGGIGLLALKIALITK